MSRFRYRDDDESSAGTIAGVLAGALAGFAVGMLVAQRVGGIGGLTSRLRRRGAAAGRGYAEDADEAEELDEYETDELVDEEAGEPLEERVLEAFRNDPTLSERAVDIGELREGVIELAGWVETDDEARHAVTIARGVPGVDTVVNRITVGEDERRFGESARRVDEGDPALTEARWEGQRVGTGRRRQGTSAEMDRHADPKVDLEQRWLATDANLDSAAEDVEAIAERRRSTKRAARADRTGGGPVAPTGVPKGDHVASPREADERTARNEAARDTGGVRANFGDVDRT
ncbi:MAG TPA: BON domain-containing protein [Gemmatimonadaceae bacterium]|nr:BON domain-containing protein [Gemmatimonadaceae bacterium]